MIADDKKMSDHEYIIWLLNTYNVQNTIFFILARTIFVYNY